MPELPEVETIIRELKPKVRNRTFVDIWTDSRKLIKKPESFNRFKKEIKGKKILDIRRMGKNIIFDLSGDKKLLIHQKMTGHLLFGKWKKIKNKWVSEISGPMKDDWANQFIHIMFFLDKSKQLALSDIRKFAKVELWGSDEMNEDESLGKLGPDPFDKFLTFDKFKEILPKKGKIKQILMDQTVISGIGNIYSDEILWQSKIHPLKEVSLLSNSELKRIYNAISKVLKKAIELKGDSMSDYRRPDGKKGEYQDFQKVYRKEGKPCPVKKCGIIKRIKIGSRSARFCPICQQL
jgi:formamidopyrimidine-DNA glycosylase